MWDIDSLLQGSGNNVHGKSTADSDDDNMDMDTDNIPPKSSKGSMIYDFFYKEIKTKHFTSFRFFFLEKLCK